jgi:hypothetical protein
VVALVALDATSGATKASVAVPEGNRAQRLLLAGSRLVLDSGTVVDLPIPGGAPPVFSNGNGLSAFPDGARICSGLSVLAVGMVRLFGNCLVADQSPRTARRST